MITVYGIETTCPSSVRKNALGWNDMITVYGIETISS